MPEPKDVTGSAAELGGAEDNDGLSGDDRPQTSAEGDLAAHDPDGLDLARQLARAVAKARPASGSVPANRRTKRRNRRPPTGQVSGAHPDDRDPQMLEDLVDRLVADHGWAVDLRVQGIFARWEQLVGSEVGAHCRPEGFADGKLTVQTDSTAWATQLRLLAPTLQQRLNQELGADTVRSVEVRGPAAPSWSKGLRRVKGKGPGDTYG